MDSFWAKAHGCQADDGYELLQAYLQAQGEILAAEAARFLGCDLEALLPLLQRLVDEGLAAPSGSGNAQIYRRQEHSPPLKTE